MFEFAICLTLITVGSLGVARIGLVFAVGRLDKTTTQGEK